MIKKLTPLLIFFLFNTSFAMDYPKLEKYVNDYTGVLSGWCVMDLDEFCMGVEDNTTVAIGIVIMESLGEEDLIEYTNKLFKGSWVGNETNGLLIAFFMNERMFEVESSESVESVLPDEQIYQIIDEMLIPKFEEGDYCGGLALTIYSIGSELNKNPIPTTTTIQQQRERHSSSREIALVVVILCIVFVIITIIYQSSLKSGKIYKKKK